MSKREYKSGVFSMLLEEPKNALEVYNALNGSNYKDESLIKITRLSGRIMLSVGNDASFLIDEIRNMYEHQSTYNPNMPLRFMLYLADMLWKEINDKGLNLYGSKLIELDTPKFVVFYNGKEKRPAKEVLKLSDSYKNKSIKFDLDLECTVYNINKDCNNELMDNSKVLMGYMTFVDKVRTYEGELKDLDVAIKRAIDECIEEDILAEFFKKNRAEVADVAAYDFTFERQLELTARDSREDGRTEGRAEGISCGRAQIIEGLLRKGKTKEEIHDLLDLSLEEIKAVEESLLATAK